MTRLKKLCSLEGVSGREDAVREYILQALEASPAEIQASTDALGNVIAQVRGKKRAVNKLAFVAHMDEVGFIITGATDDGYLRFATVGGIESSVIFGRRVRINGKYGVVGGKAVHQIKGDDKKKEVPFDKLLIDVAAENKQEALNIAKPGDVAVFDSDYAELYGDRLKARAIDDRAGCALLLEMAAQTPEYDITLAFTVQEEVELRGAKTAAFQINPDIAVIVDSTTAADTAGVESDKQVCRVGGGPVISFMDKRTLYDIKLYDTIFETAKKIGIKAQTKSMVAGGNDAGAIQLSRKGVRVAAVSLPCRYLHSPSCVILQADFDAALKLLNALTCEFAVMDELA
ncbi:MAG: M20/M25/M40 family metallo-hydrolase [Oscillospiraceae bacterium]|nr:M20/M25/M40 family metallo-hydrolase [Oscillospiraceae bacterium]